MPIYTQHPENSEIRRALWNGKYSDTVMKLELTCDFLGGLLSASSTITTILLTILEPHIGSAYDAHIFLRNWNRHEVLPGEYGLGDGHYSCLDFMVCPPKEPPNRHMTDEEYMLAATISHYRARIEHLNARIDCHRMFQHDFRCSFYILEAVTAITTNATEFLSYKHVWYPPFGNWSHFC